MALINVFDPANRAPDPSFEDGGIGWVRTGLATVVTTQHHTLLRSMRLRTRAGGAPDESEATFVPKNAVVGNMYSCKFWALPDNAGLSPAPFISLRVLVDYGSGVFSTKLTTNYQGTPGWYFENGNVETEVYLGPGPFRIRLASTTVAGPPGIYDMSWFIDDVEVEDVTGNLPPAAPANLTMPENTPGRVRFQRGVIDEVSGTIHKEGGVVRDLDDRLRQSDDVDQPDHGHFRESWPLPSPRLETEP